MVGKGRKQFRTTNCAGHEIKLSIRTMVAHPKKPVSIEQQARQFDETRDRHRKLWDGINQFVSRHGGHVVSPPYTKRLLIQVPQFSEIPDRLYDLGFVDLAAAGTSTRVTPQGLEPVICFSFSIPVK
jgi:hypothetical protein